MPKHDQWLAICVGFAIAVVQCAYSDYTFNNQLSQSIKPITMSYDYTRNLAEIKDLIKKL